MKQQRGICFCLQTPPPPPPPPTVAMGSIDKMSAFSEHGHVAYQFKWNHEIQQHGSKLLWSQTSPPPTTLGGWGQKVKIQLFQNMVTLHIKLESNHEFSDMVTNILPEAPPPPIPHQTLRMRPKGKNSTFQNMVMLHIKLNGITKCTKMIANTLGVKM